MDKLRFAVVFAGDAYEDDEQPEYVGDPWQVAGRAGIRALSDKDFLAGVVDLESNELVGAAFFGVDLGSGVYSFDVGVLPEYEGLGIGGELVRVCLHDYAELAEDYPEELRLIVDVVNPVMRAMLLKRGLRVKRKVHESRWIMYLPKG